MSSNPKNKATKKEALGMLYNGDFTLNEFSDEATSKNANHHEEFKPEFPLEFDATNISIDVRPFSDKTDAFCRELTFKGHYKTLDIVCTCIIPSIDASYFDQMSQHEWEMSERLMPCRNMATYFTHFKANQHSFLDDGSSSSVWYFIKPYYKRGTLAQYWMEKRDQSVLIEPLYILQIAISLFSAIADAHCLNIGLLDISMDTLWLGMNDVVYFGGFKSSLRLQDNNHKNQPWIDFDLLQCPEKNTIKTEGYTQETDVYLASLVILQLMQTTDKLKAIGNEGIVISRDDFDSMYTSIISAIEPGLRLKGQDRPSAVAMLRYFESMRYSALA